MPKKQTKKWFFTIEEKKRNFGQRIRVCFEKMKSSERKTLLRAKNVWEWLATLRCCWWSSSNNSNSNNNCCDHHLLLETTHNVAEEEKLKLSNLSFVWQFNFAQMEKIFHLFSSSIFGCQYHYFDLGQFLNLSPLLHSISAFTWCKGYIKGVSIYLVNLALRCKSKQIPFSIVAA